MEISKINEQLEKFVESSSLSLDEVIQCFKNALPKDCSFVECNLEELDKNSKGRFGNIVFDTVYARFTVRFFVTNENHFNMDETPKMVLSAFGREDEYKIKIKHIWGVYNTEEKVEKMFASIVKEMLQKQDNIVNSLNNNDSTKDVEELIKKKFGQEEIFNLDFLKETSFGSIYAFKSDYMHNSRGVICAVKDGKVKKLSTNDIIAIIKE